MITRRNVLAGATALGAAVLTRSGFAQASIAEQPHLVLASQQLVVEAYGQDAVRGLRAWAQDDAAHHGAAGSPGSHSVLGGREAPMGPFISLLVFDGDTPEDIAVAAAQRAAKDCGLAVAVVLGHQSDADLDRLGQRLGICTVATPNVGAALACWAQPLLEVPGALGWAPDDVKAVAPSTRVGRVFEWDGLGRSPVSSLDMSESTGALINFSMADGSTLTEVSAAVSAMADELPVDAEILFLSMPRAGGQKVVATLLREPLARPPTT